MLLLSYDEYGKCKKLLLFQSIATNSSGYLVPFPFDFNQV